MHGILLIHKTYLTPHSYIVDEEYFYIWSFVPMGFECFCGAEHRREVVTGSTYRRKFRSNVAGGVDVEYQSSEACAFSAGLWYREGGARYKDQTILMDETEGTGRAFHDGYVRLNYLALPLMAHVYLAKGLAVNGGLEVAWLIRQKAQYQMQTYTFDAEHKSWTTTAVPPTISGCSPFPWD